MKVCNIPSNLNTHEYMHRLKNKLLFTQKYIYLVWFLVGENAKKEVLGSRSS